MSRQNSVSIERRIERLWYGGSRVAYLLLPFAWIFQLLVGLRRVAYRTGLFATADCGVPVVVVGNITVGGAGKTPLVGWIAGKLAADGRNVGILSRGYGGTAANEPTLVMRDSLAKDVGDEALLLARQTTARVCICADRVAGARWLIDESGVDVIVCDDGLQHYRLGRDLEIAVIDGARGLGNRLMLPAGPLREPPGRLHDVDFVFVNGDARATDARRFGLRPGRVQSLVDDRDRDLAEFGGCRVWAVAGIGNPERFAEMLRGAGIDPELVDVPDHGTVSLHALRSEQPWPILMTAKDAVKYPEVTDVDAWCVPVHVEMPAADEADLMKQLRRLHDDV